MANTTYRDMGFKIDGAAGTLVDIKAYLSSAELAAALALIEDTGMSDNTNSNLSGLAGATVSIAGMVNTTTDAIFGPLIGAFTSITKTVEYKAYANRFYNGEVRLGNVRYSGGNGALQVFSGDMTFDGSVNRTSVALA